MKIMIIDGSTAMRMIVRKTLRVAGFEGHEYSEFDDAKKAFAAIKASRPDLILSDWNMPNMTGIELIEALAREESRSNSGSSPPRRRPTCASARRPQERASSSRSRSHPAPSRRLWEGTSHEHRLL